MDSSVSIVVPTFNRVNSLVRLMKSIMPLSKEYNIPIVIVDNNSTDATPDICSELMNRHKLITYVRNHVNIGMEMNILRSMLLARTSHVWCIGDDDELSPEAVASFKKYNYYDMIVNSDATFVVVRTILNAPLKRRFVFTRFSDFAKYFYGTDIEVLTGITWISGVILKRSLVDAGAGVSKLNQNFAHTYSYLSNLIDSGGKVSVIPKRLVGEQQIKMQRSADSGSYLERTFQTAVYLVLDKIATECGVEGRMSYLSYINEISLRYNVSPSVLMKGHFPWHC